MREIEWNERKNGDERIHGKENIVLNYQILKYKTGSSLREVFLFQ
jgi:hypothetical protein